MAKLNFMDRENLLREYEMKEEVTTIGREATNVIVIADPSVSRLHATVEKKEDGYYLVDKNSSNGTFINGKKVSRQKLSHQDKVNLGNASMVFEDEEQVAATFILPRSEMPPIPDGATRAESPRSREEEPTNSIELPPMPPPPRPSPAPPRIERAATPPPPPAPAPARPPVAAPSPVVASTPKPEAPAAVCPSCKKPVEPGSRFCGFCGSTISPSKPAGPPPVLPPAVGRQSFPPEARSPIPPAPQSAKPPVAPPPVPRKAPVSVPTSGLNYAGFAVRLVAYLIDVGILLLLMLVPLVIMMVLIMRSPDDPSPVSMMINAACFILISVISIGYQLYFVGAKGATPGKKIMKLKVTLPDGTFPIGYGKAFLRMIGYAVSGMICYIGFLMIAFDKEQHRGLHDKIAGTVVIKES